MRISDWSSDVCSSDLAEVVLRRRVAPVGAAAVSLEGGGVVAGGEGLVGRRERRRAQQEALHEVELDMAADARRHGFRLAAGAGGLGVADVAAEQDGEEAVVHEVAAVCPRRLAGRSGERPVGQAWVGQGAFGWSRTT